MTEHGKRDRGRIISGVQASPHRFDPRIREAMELVRAAYGALSEEPPARGRAHQYLRRAIAALSAVADPLTAEAMRIADALREADPQGPLGVIRAGLLEANAALLELGRTSVEPARASEA